MKNKKSSKLWFQQSYHNFLLAKKNYEIMGYDVSAFLCQQSIELLLKSVIIYTEKKLDKSHYLDVLVKKVDIPEDLRKDIISLTIDYFLSRYPDVSDMVPYKQYTKEIVKEKIEIVEKVFDYFLEKIGDFKKWKEEISL